jgi:probable addiction module antidote protein
MTEIVSKTGLSRESLYKAFSAESSPEFATILKLMRALDLKVIVKAA